MTELINWPEVLQPVIATLLTALAGLLVAIATKVLQRYGIEVTEDRKDQLEHAARRVVLWVEELAANAIKKNPEAALTSEQKRHMGVDELRREFPKKPVSEIEKALTTALPEVGLGAAVGQGKSLPPAA